MLLWFADLMDVTEEVTIHRPNIVTFSGKFIKSANQSSIKLCLAIKIDDPSSMQDACHI